MDFAIALIIGTGLGWVVAEIMVTWFRWRHDQTLPSEAQIIQQELDSGNLIPLTVEVADNHYLCYNSITNEFVCQGANFDEIRERFKARYPDKNAAIHRGDSEAVAVLKAQLKARHENSSDI